MMKRLKKLFPILALVPFVMGFVGYYMAGCRLTDAMYNSVSLYVIQQNADSANIYTEIARWSAALVATAAVLSVLEKAGRYLYNSILSLFAGSAALYGDEKIVREICDKEKKAFFGGDSPVNANHHILLYPDDAENLRFYRDNREKMQKGHVWLAVRQLDLSFLKADNINLHFFNPNAIIAGYLWNDPELEQRIKEEKQTQIAILGFESLGEQILMQGFLHNVFYVDQAYRYHIFDAANVNDFEKERFVSMNRDEVIFHSNSIGSEETDLSDLDVIICTKDIDFNVMELLWIRYPKALIYIYSESDLELKDFMVDNRVHFFGEADRIYTLNNIITDQLYRNGILLNYNYDHPDATCPNFDALLADENAIKEARDSWANLNEFTKGSNIASADYMMIVNRLGKEAEYEKMEESERDWCFARLEHILWCRYHFMNYWNYGTPENGKNKDAVRRIHTCLLDFDDLSEEDKRKDLDVILCGRKWGMIH